MQNADTITTRVDAAARIPQDRLNEVVAAPKSIKIELTSKCNYGCSYCAQPSRGAARRDMDRQTFARIAKEALDAGVKEFGLFYLGEPFMAPELLVDSIALLKKVGAEYVFLTSNASLALPWQVKRCMKAGLDSLKWSVNVATPEEFEATMHRPAGVWQNALRNVEKVHAMRKKLGLKTKLYASSIRYADQTPEREAAMKVLLEKHILPFVDEHYWLPLYSMGMGGTLSVGTPTPGNQGRADNPVPPLPCWNLFTAAHVRVDGHMTACCFDATGDWDIGDLTTTSFVDCWNSEKMQKLRSAHLKKNVKGTACQNCCMLPAERATTPAKE